MSSFAQIPEFISCTSNLRFVFLGMEANWGCITSFTFAISILGVILFIYFLLSRQDGSHEIAQKSKIESATSNPQSQQLLKDDMKAAQGEDLLPLLLALQQQQQTIKVDTDKLVANITILEQSIKDIGESTKNLDRVITGAQSKGALGEQIVERNLSQLPHEWIRKNVPFRNDTHVEFCVCSPDGRLIPIDSKWAGTRLLGDLARASDKDEKDRIIRDVKREVYTRALEVGKYLDDHRTIGFGIATVPDAVFDLCLDIQPYLIKSKIVLVSYSMLVPYILLLVKLFLSNAHATQAMQKSHILSSTLIEIEQIQELIDTRLRKPLDTFKQQQSEYRSQSEGIEKIYQQFLQIQKDLELIKLSSPINDGALSNSEISAIPDELKHRVEELRKSLIDNNVQPSDHVSNDIPQQPMG